MVMNRLPISVYTLEMLGVRQPRPQTVDEQDARAHRGFTLIRFDTYTCGVCAVSCMFKWDVSTIMEYKGLPLQQAVDCYVRDTLQNIRRQLLSIISQYKLFINLY
uniref:Uncharacterized protein n=1 Tax=Zea mays TaxID=4577 RepID=B6TKZ1_MAIZE|nr:hypothetical protein [Zea mays]